MKQTVVFGLAITVFLTALPSPAEDHLVSLSAMQAGLSQATTRRESDLAEVQSVLVSPAGVFVPRQIGLDAATLSHEAAVLNDDDLRELAQRVEVLQTDPVAGGTGKVLLIIAIVIVTLVVLFSLACNNRAASCVGF